MAALYQFEVMLVAVQLRFLRGLQRKTELGIELPKRGRQHGLDVGAEYLGFGNTLAQTRKSLPVRSFDAKLDSGLLQRLRQLRQLGPQGRRTEKMKNFAQQLQVHRTNCMYLRST